MAKEFLSRKGIPYQDRDVSRDPSLARELVARTGQMAVPVIFIDGQMVIGFNEARLEQIISMAQAQHPTFGAAIADAAKVAAGAGPPVTSGAYVGRVRPGSAAERAGLAPGDVITAMNSQPVATAADFEGALSRVVRGSRFSLTMLRGGSTITKEATL